MSTNRVDFKISHDEDRPVDRMTEAQLHEFREAFNNFDKDRSGYIEAFELKQLCEWVGQEATEAEIQEMVDLGASSFLPHSLRPFDLL